MMTHEMIARQTVILFMSASLTQPASLQQPVAETGISKSTMLA
jgi:hypothetical protein